MKTKNEYQGLCETCKNGRTCAFVRDAGTPVLQCEEFGLLPTASRAGAVLEPEPAGVKRTKRAKGEAAGDYLGLCRDCEGRADCTFSRPEGGVWHCEEYQ